MVKTESEQRMPPIIIEGVFTDYFSAFGGLKRGVKRGVEGGAEWAPEGEALESHEFGKISIAPGSFSMAPSWKRQDWIIWASSFLDTLSSCDKKSGSFSGSSLLAIAPGYGSSCKGFDSSDTMDKEALNISQPAESSSESSSGAPSQGDLFSSPGPATESSAGVAPVIMGDDPESGKDEGDCIDRPNRDRDGSKGDRAQGAISAVSDERYSLNNDSSFFDPARFLRTLRRDGLVFQIPKGLREFPFAPGDMIWMLFSGETVWTGLGAGMNSSDLLSNISLDSNRSLKNSDCAVPDFSPPPFAAVVGDGLLVRARSCVFR